MLGKKCFGRIDFLTVMAVTCVLLLLPGMAPGQERDVLVEEGEQILLVALEAPGGDALSDSLATTISNTIGLNLSLALNQDIRRVDFLAPAVALERSRAFMRGEGIDHMIYGEVDRRDDGSLAVVIRAWSELHDETLVELDEEITELIAVFDAADRIVDRFVEELTGEQFEFATVTFENTGENFPYVVYVDGRRLGEDIDEYAIPAGTRDIAVFQPSTFGELLVHQEELSLVPDGQETVSFELVDRDALDDDEAAREITADDFLQGSGTLRVSLFPGDAEVYLDDTPVDPASGNEVDVDLNGTEAEGGVPGERGELVLEDVPAGVYSIRSEREHYWTLEDAVVIRDGEETEFSRNLILDRSDPQVTAGLPDANLAVTAATALSVTQVFMGALLPDTIDIDRVEGIAFISPRIGHAAGGDPVTSLLLTAAVGGAGALATLPAIQDSDFPGDAIVGGVWASAAVYDAIGAGAVASRNREVALERYEADGFAAPPVTEPHQRLSIRSRVGGGSLAAAGADFSWASGFVTTDLEAGIGHSGLGVVRAPRYQLRGGVTAYPLRGISGVFELGTGVHYGLTFAETFGQETAHSMIPRLEFGAKIGRFNPSVGLHYIISGADSPFDGDATMLAPSLNLRWGAL